MPAQQIEKIEIAPQDGPQNAILSSTADIVIAGGAAGGGKTYALLMEPLRHYNNHDFGAVIFRRTYPQIVNEGGLWDEAATLYPMLGGEAHEGQHYYTFGRKGMRVSFRHLQHEKDVLSWRGAQVPCVLFDQLEEFTEYQFWYMFSRNRSARAGIRPYIRGTCNPVPDDDDIGGWLNRLISWWWDPETGYAIKERSGVVRWFARLGDKLHWGASRVELWRHFPDHVCAHQAFECACRKIHPKSLTFIPADLDDNKILERADPSYRAALMAMPLIERERLLKGNWKIKATAGTVFNRAWLKLLPALPTDIRRVIRYWDKAGTEGGSGAQSAGVLLGERVLPEGQKRWIVIDVVAGRWSSYGREKVIKDTATLDREKWGSRVIIWTEQEPGSGGKESAENTVRNLAGHSIYTDRVSGDKLTRAGPLAAQAEAGNVDVMIAPWTEEYLRQLHNFDGVSGLRDQVDGSTGAFNKLTGGPAEVRMREAQWGGS